MSVRDNLVAPKAATITVLDTLEEISANTTSGKPAGALAVKQLDNKLGGLRFGKDGDGNYGYYGADGSLVPFKGGFDEAEVYHGLTSYTFTKDYAVVYATSHRGNTTVPPFYLNDVAQTYISEVHGNSTASGAYLFHDIKSGDIVKTTGALTVICFK